MLQNSGQGNALAKTSKNQNFRVADLQGEDKSVTLIKNPKHVFTSVDLHEISEKNAFEEESKNIDSSKQIKDPSAYT